MKTKGLSSFLPPTRLHAFIVGMGVMAGIFIGLWATLGLGGCASDTAGARQIPARRVVYMKGADGRTIAVAPGPEVVE